MFSSVLRILSVAGTIAAAVLFAIAAASSLFDQHGELGWGLFCLAVGIAAHYLEGGVTVFGVTVKGDGT